jgi:hypothetical protein
MKYGRLCRNPVCGRIAALICARTYEGLRTNVMENGEWNLVFLNLQRTRF